MTQASIHSSIYDERYNSGFELPGPLVRTIVSPLMAYLYLLKVQIQILI